MAKQKYYAVLIGKKTGIYSTWEQCKEQINGYSGAIFKAFTTMEDAERYILETEEDMSSVNKENEIVSTDKLNTLIENRIADLKEDEVIAFVDGSYDVKGEISAFGAIIFSHGGNKDTLYKAFNKQLNEDFISLRNVAAELEGVKEVINWVIKYNKRKICVYYDYEGIEKWANGQWKANKELTKDYVHFINENKAFLEISFEKVPAHSGIRYNEDVDAIAKNAILAKGYKTYNDGSVYFVGYGLDDWKTIVQLINDENKSLDGKAISSIDISVKNIETRNKIVIKQLDNIVVINCYRNSKSYVQGKQTVLFQKIISTAIELLKSKESVIETLNSYHALTLKTEEVENKFEQLLPNYKHFSEKHYANLLSAVYNTMLTGYMPDYTCLVTPIFRAYEYYLHRVLSEHMSLDTETDSGKIILHFSLKIVQDIMNVITMQKKS